MINQPQDSNVFDDNDNENGVHRSGSYVAMKIF